MNLIKEISEGLGKEDLGWEELAMAAVQQAAEEYLVELVSDVRGTEGQADEDSQFNHTQRAAVHAGSATIRVEDMQCIRDIRKVFGRRE